jgi:hypothetical protein
VNTLRTSQTTPPIKLNVIEVSIFSKSMVIICKPCLLSIADYALLLGHETVYRFG